MTAKIQIRRDTTANWAAGTPPTLSVGEIGLDTDLKQIKIGDGSSNWTALPWLSGTLPYFSSPAADIDGATNRVTGVYRWAGIASITSGTVPVAPIDIKTADGGINMLVLKFGSTVMQNLWTDGDGTVTPKTYSRVYDGDVSLWRAWTPQSSWGISATEGVNLAAKSALLKDTLTVDGASTLTGTVALGGKISVPDSVAATPGIFHTGDTNTGIAFPSAGDSVIIATSGVAAVTVGSAGGVTIAGNLVTSGNFQVTGALSAALAAGGNKITGLGDPTAAQDAVTKAYLESVRVGAVAILHLGSPSIVKQHCGTVSSGIFTYASGLLRSVTGTWYGVFADGNGLFGSVTVTTSSATFSTPASIVGEPLNFSTGAYWMVFTRTA